MFRLICKINVWGPSYMTRFTEPFWLSVKLGLAGRNLHVIWEWETGTLSYRISSFFIVYLYNYIHKKGPAQECEADSRAGPAVHETWLSTGPRNTLFCTSYRISFASSHKKGPVSVRPKLLNYTGKRGQHIPSCEFFVPFLYPLKIV